LLLPLPFFRSFPLGTCFSREARPFAIRQPTTRSLAHRDLSSPPTPQKSPTPL
jgi:hypothetical protein